MKADGAAGLSKCWFWVRADGGQSIDVTGSLTYMDIDFREESKPETEMSQCQV